MNNNDNKKFLGIMGFAAIAAILTLGMVAVSMQSQLADAAAANKGGFATNQVQPIFDATPTDVPAEPTLIAWYHFKSSNYNDWGANFIAECATANHIQGKGKMSDFEGARTGVQVFFTHELPNGTENVVHIDGTEEEYDSTDVPSEATWNMCSQTFEIKTQLNALIEEVDVDYDGDGIVDDTKLQFVCDEFLEDGVTPNPDWDSTVCQQYVELFLETAGTHPAKAFLANVPHGENAVKVYAIFDAESQELEADRTSVAIGKRMLDLYPVLSDNSNP
ncbi:MAG: hypothetical protein OEM89_03925 [Nitrosopumilus sp.]|nr:hypothetical protein [Nitrosopumilus sp.]